MFPRLKRLAVLAVMTVGPLLLTGFHGAAGQDAASNAADQPRVRTWTDRSGEHQTEASLVDSQDGKVTLKKKDGSTITVPLENLSDADQMYVKHHTPGGNRVADPIEEVGPAARPKPRGPSSQYDRGGKNSRPASAQAKDVIVTGVDMDPEKAIQNAFSQAIEQTVGVLVDAVTVVKNDQIIRDEILTYSRGYVQKYEVIKRWEEGGQHHARIRAVVAREKLVEKLEKLNIAVKPVEGEREATNIAIAVENEAHAAKMLKNALAGFQMHKLTKVTFNEPEVVRDGANAKLQIKVKVSPDLQQWQQLSQDLRRVLAAASGTKHAVINVSGETMGGVSIDSFDLATSRTGVASQGNGAARAPRRGGGGATGFAFGPSPQELALQRQLEGQGVLVSLLLEASVNGGQTKWEVFRVPEAMEAPIQDAATKQYRLTYSLMDKQGKTVLQTHEAVQTFGVTYKSIVKRRAQINFTSSFETWWIGPMWWGDGFVAGGHHVFLHTENAIAVSQEDLRKVAKTDVILEEDAKGR